MSRKGGGRWGVECCKQSVEAGEKSSEISRFQRGKSSIKYDNTLRRHISRGRKPTQKERQQWMPLNARGL